MQSQPFRKSKPKGHALMITAVVLVVIVVAGGGIAGLVYLRHPQPQNSSNGSNEPTVMISGPGTGTAGTAVTFAAIGSGGVTPFTFTWTAPGGGTLSGSGTSFTTTYNSAGSFTISVTVTDADAKIAT